MESLGDKLKTAREAKGFSYDYISRETNIAVKYLEALEREDFSGFPGEPYVLGFLKNYGEFLGLNPDGLLTLYRSLVIQEQPVPVEQLITHPPAVPRTVKIAAVALSAAGLAAAAFFFFSRLPDSPPPPEEAERVASEYTLTQDFLERRFYPGDSVLVSSGAGTYKLVFAALSDAVTVSTPRGEVMLDLGQEVTVDLNNDGFAGLKITAADFAENDSVSGAQLRFEHIAPPQAAAVPLEEIPLEEIPLDTPAAAGGDAPPPVFSSPNPYPFTLQAAFQGYCLFRYEVLFERDKPGRNEQYYQRSEEISVTAQNGIRLGVSNAQAVKLQVTGNSRTVPVELGGAGEVVAADLRWVRDGTSGYRLVLSRLE